MGSGQQRIMRMGSGQQRIMRMGSGQQCIMRMGSGKQCIMRMGSGQQCNMHKRTEIITRHFKVTAFCNDKYLPEMLKKYLNIF